MAESTESQTSPSVTLPPATKAGGLARVWRLILPLCFWEWDGLHSIIGCNQKSGKSGSEVYPNCQRRE